MIRRRIVPVQPDSAGRIVARAPVRAVFDTNGAGELLEVVYRQNPIDAIEVLLTYAPYGQVYVEIHE